MLLSLLVRCVNVNEFSRLGALKCYRLVQSSNQSKYVNNQRSDPQQSTNDREEVDQDTKFKRPESCEPREPDNSVPSLSSEVNYVIHPSDVNTN